MHIYSSHSFIDTIVAANNAVAKRLIADLFYARRYNLIKLTEHNLLTEYLIPPRRSHIARKMAG